MKRLILILALLVSGCKGQPQSSVSVSKDFVVDRLFQVDGISVYRFADEGRTIYFCAKGTSWDEIHSGGKTTWTEHKSVQTADER